MTRVFAQKRTYYNGSKNLGDWLTRGVDDRFVEQEG